MSDELLPCPFCGSSPSIIEDTSADVNSSRDLWYIACSNPNCVVDGGNLYAGKITAIVAWNIRFDSKAKGEEKRMTDKLLPCPFCASRARYGVNDTKTVWWCECTNPDCLAATVSVSDKQKAAGIWNKRAGAGTQSATLRPVVFTEADKEALSELE